MKTATELYEISKTNAPKIVANILEGVKEHVIKRCEEEANKGATYYYIRLNKGLCFIKDLLLEECIKLAKEFEDHGYKVYIENYGNGYYVNFTMSFSWNNKLIEFDNRVFRHSELLYTTDDGIITKK